MRKCKECGQEVKDSVPAIAERHGGYLQRHPELTIHQVIARIQTALDEGVKAATQMESRRYEECLDTLQTESQMHGDTKADRDRLKTVGRSESARLQIVRKERDELLELRKHMATPIDNAEIERVAKDLLADLGYNPMVRTQIKQVSDALNTIAGRPLLAVTEDELADEIRASTESDGNSDWVNPGYVMEFLRSRCRVVPGEDEIRQAVMCPAPGHRGLIVSNVMHLLTAPASGGDADG